MAKVIAAGSAFLRSVPAATPPAAPGLNHGAAARYEAAQAATAWALRHRRRYALVQSDQVLASAVTYDLTGTLDLQRVTIRGVAEAVNHLSGDAGDHRGALVETLVEDAVREGADLALFFPTAGPSLPVPAGFMAVPTTDLELTVAQSPRHGAPMTLVRGGEDRDLDAIAAMGAARARGVRFHLDRDAPFIKHCITRQRLLAGLGAAGVRQLEFNIAEEGITAAAYVVISVRGGTWTIEECGDRDASGARVGALLQALLAREAAEARPVIRGWLPPGFRPPQIAIAPAPAGRPRLFLRALSPRWQGLHLPAADLVYWRADLFS